MFDDNGRRRAEQIPRTTAQNYDSSENVSVAAMFAVPGWSVSADTLQAQVELRGQKPPGAPNPTEISGAGKKSRKRKRGYGSSRGVEVTDENLGDLWRKCIEEKSLGRLAGEPERGTKKKKKRRQREQEARKENVEADGDISQTFTAGKGSSEPTNENFTKEREQKKHENRKGNLSPAFQKNGHESAGKGLPSSEKDTPQHADGRAKYEWRKAEAAKKREQKALLKANGTLPLTRPGLTSTTSPNAAGHLSAKSSEAPTPSSLTILSAYLVL